MAFSFKQIRYFIATAETGSISKASQQLYISQSAVTTAILDLESTLSVNLFVRSYYGMELTYAGRQFLSYAYEIMSKIDKAMLLKEENLEVKGTIRIAASYTVIGYFLPYHLERLKLLYPELIIKLYEMNRIDIEDALIDDSIDIAVLITSNINNRKLVKETLLQSKRQLWLPSKHPLLNEKSNTLNTISKYPYIMLTVDEAKKSAMKYWNRTKLKPNIYVETYSVEAVRSMVANNLGITVLADMVYRPWSLEGKHIERVTLSSSVPSMDIGLAWKKNKTLTPMMKLIKSYFNKFTEDKE